MKKIALFKKQKQFFHLKDREALLEAGISYGKSRVASIWLANQCQIYPKTKWFMAARDYGQLKAAIDQEFEFYLNDILGLERNVHYKKTKGSPIEYVWRNGSIIYGVGAQNYDTVFRAGNYSGVWGDEVDYWKPEAVKALRGRIRVFPELLRFTSSPKGYNHIWEDFYQNKVGTVINATTLENPTLSEAFIHSLRSTYSPRLFEQEVLGKRLQLNIGAVYPEFDRTIHVKPCQDVVEPNDEIYFFTDYNVAHYCGCYMIKKKIPLEHKPGWREVVYVLSEEHLEYKTTRDMALCVRSKFTDNNKIVIGDSTGNNKKDVAITRTNYAQFKEMGLLTKHFMNPPVQSRIINANSRFHHKLVVIDPSCKNLIRDLELVAWKENGSDIDKSDLTLSHASDAFGYGLWYFLPLKPISNAKVISQRK